MPIPPFPKGTTQTFTLAPSPKTVQPLQVKIVGAAYGNDTTDVSIDKTGLSVKLQVNLGTDRLVITVASPNANDGAYLMLAGKPVDEFVVTEHWDGDVLYVQGT